MNTLLAKVLKEAKRHADADPSALVEVYTVPEQRCVWISDSHRQILGFDPEELVGIHWKDIVDPKDHAHKDIMLNDALLTGGSMEIGFSLIAKSGRRIDVKVIDTLFEDAEAEHSYVICRTTQIGK
jgi:PAS domain S-box-containing protein